MQVSLIEVLMPIGIKAVAVGSIKFSVLLEQARAENIGFSTSFKVNLLSEIPKILLSFVKPNKQDLQVVYESLDGSKKYLLHFIKAPDNSFLISMTPLNYESQKLYLLDRFKVIEVLKKHRLKFNWREVSA